MRQIIYVVVTMLVLQVAATRAEKVKFECDENLFESATSTEHEVSLLNYDTPLYDGLWPMTRAAFRCLDWARDEEAFTFSIASRDWRSLRESMSKLTRDRFTELERLDQWDGFSR